MPSHAVLFSSASPLALPNPSFCCSINPSWLNCKAFSPPCRSAWLKEAEGGTRGRPPPSSFLLRFYEQKTNEESIANIPDTLVHVNVWTGRAVVADVSCHSRERRSGAGGEEESKEEIEQRTGRCWVGLHSSASWRRLSAHTPAERKSEDERGALQHKVSERTGQRMWRRKARRGITASG